MPAMLDDPARPTIYRTSGDAPFPTPNDPHLPATIFPRQVTLRDRVTIATLVPFSSYTQLPASLLAYLCDQLNREIEKGDTYPMIEPMSPAAFGAYWFSNFGAVMLLGQVDRAEDVVEGKDWGTECLGSFYVKPNYPGRSSHVCNGGFLVCDAARNRGVGRLMGEGYLEWAPILGFSYSVFNLVYETNVASCRIWDALGFKRIGRVKGCGQLKSYPDQLIDAIIYGRDLGPDGEDFVSEERFDKIKFYLKHGKYPNGADRAEKSRLRSAATHYKLTEDDRLMLKKKEVVSDPQRQYEIARSVHMQQHGGINKTTAAIAEKHHWVRIKETVSLVIRNCTECKEMGKAPVVRADAPPTMRASEVIAGQGGVSAAGRVLSLPTQRLEGENRTSAAQSSPRHLSSQAAQLPPQDIPLPTTLGNMPTLPGYGDLPLDPQIMEDVQHHLPHYHPGHGDDDDDEDDDDDDDDDDDNDDKGTDDVTFDVPNNPFSTASAPQAIHHTNYQALLEGRDEPLHQVLPPPPPSGARISPAAGHERGVDAVMGDATNDDENDDEDDDDGGNGNETADFDASTNQRATAAARAAQEAMVDMSDIAGMVGASLDGALGAEELDIKRQLIDAGFADVDDDNDNDNDIGEGGVAEE
ncbi:MAG: hypothetical protein M1838_001909 [Thelocarpon superellum]|nr:MAG: hypothetical protein M1838_001909 [Thelocarpon superellum]